MPCVGAPEGRTRGIRTTFCLAPCNGARREMASLSRSVATGVRSAKGGRRRDSVIFAWQGRA